MIVSILVLDQEHHVGWHRFEQALLLSADHHLAHYTGTTINILCQLGSVVSRRSCVEAGACYCGQMAQRNLARDQGATNECGTFPI
jgi:hypothetical protein